MATDIVERLHAAAQRAPSLRDDLQEAARLIEKQRRSITEILTAKQYLTETHATWAEQMAGNEPDGYYGQGCNEVAAAIRAGAPVILPRPWLD
jgi:hypothetical protein